MDDDFQDLAPTSATELRTSAWDGAAADGLVGPEFPRWGGVRDMPAVTKLLGPAPIDEADWQDPRVGWGVVLPDADDMDNAAKATAADAQPCIQKLIAGRGNAPVFRYHPSLREGRLRRYASNGSYSEPKLSGPRGVAPNAIPRYLLIVASPEEIPWAFQYRLQTDAHVGRLDLDAVALERYVESLLADWADSSADRTRPVVWASDHGHPDITRLMRRTIADRLRSALETDAQHEFNLDGGALFDGEATNALLTQTLAERKPAFVAATSHGATFPLDDPSAMAAQLGSPVDVNRTVLGVAALLSDWSPHGAIWYAHACCSAGCDGRSSFAGVTSETSSLTRILAGLERVGATTAPLPRALLGATHPAKAFFGHVEPTFDWTLRDPLTGQVTTQHIIDCLYGMLHQPARPPVGLALAEYQRAVAGLLYDYSEAQNAVVQGEPGAVDRQARTKLVARDQMAMVLLGDPTVRMS